MNKLKLYAVKTPIVCLSAALMGLALSLYYVTGLGSDSFSVFVQSISFKTGIEVGTMNIIINIVVVIIFFFLTRKRIGLGTLIQSILVGIFITMGSNLWFAVFGPEQPLWLGVLLSFVASTCVAIAVALYLPCNIGASAFDLLTLFVADFFKGSYKIGSWIVYGVLLTLGIILGGVWGIGTAISLIFTGIVVDFITGPITKVENKLFAKVAPEEVEEEKAEEEESPEPAETK